MDGEVLPVLDPTPMTTAESTTFPDWSYTVIGGAPAGHCR